MNKYIKNRAFTITEVLISITIIGILVLILVPVILSTMPNDHALKYKKAYYAIQGIMFDIINTPSICKGNVDDRIYLSSCKGNLREVIAERMNISEEKEELDNDLMTSDGFRWNIPNDDFSSIKYINVVEAKTVFKIVVSVDGKPPVITDDANKDIKNGIFEIYIYSNGKVIAPDGRNEIELLKTK